MSDQERMNAVMKDLDEYFRQATEDSAHNQGLARTLVVRWGLTAALMGFAWIANYLQQSASNALSLAYALNFSFALLAYIIDLVAAYGSSEALATLLAIIQTATDEDGCALAAMTFASPNFVDARGAGILRERFNRTEGTSCRMALALALYQCGEDRELKAFIQDGYLMDLESSSRSTARQTGMNDQERRRMVAGMLMPSIFCLVIEDCATNGVGFRDLYNLRQSGKPWRRKQYND